MNYTILSRERIELSDGRQGYSLPDLASQADLMARHRRAMEQLNPIPEILAAQFFNFVGVDTPTKVESHDIDRVFSNIRSIAKRGPTDGELLYLAFGGASSLGKAALYVHHVDNTGFESGLAVCKLPNETFLFHNAGRIGGKLGLGTL